MRKKQLLPILGLISLMTTPALAQEDALTSKPGALAPYKTAIGFRYSPSNKFGADLAITAKHFIRPESAIEAQVGITNYNRAYFASIQYVWQPQLLTSNRLRPYAGIGLGLSGTEFNRNGEQQPFSTNLVGLGNIGIEYTFPKVPLSLSLDYRHAIFGYKTDSFKDLPINRLNNIGIGLKYNFK
ncbi:outer membrane beta-barrel protein [Pontibacter locisalis]|uniref:Outer membrane beta-barrel protein n=1 Tax=Pontibacter locisalis TaxID=1719035 RepID=A0ABW5IKK4_9BACT